MARPKGIKAILDFLSADDAARALVAADRRFDVGLRLTWVRIDHTVAPPGTLTARDGVLVHQTLIGKPLADPPKWVEFLLYPDASAFVYEKG